MVTSPMTVALVATCAMGETVGILFGFCMAILPGRIRVRALLLDMAEHYQLWLGFATSSVIEYCIIDFPQAA